MAGPNPKSPCHVIALPVGPGQGDRNYVGEEQVCFVVNEQTGSGIHGVAPFTGRYAAILAATSFTTTASTASATWVRTVRWRVRRQCSHRSSELGDNDSRVGDNLFSVRTDRPSAIDIPAFSSSIVVPKVILHSDRRVKRVWIEQPSTRLNSSTLPLYR